MNFLVNLYLSEKSREKILANFILQAIRKHDISRYDEKISEALVFHEDILNFISGHPAYKRSCARLSPKLKKHAHIIINIFNDHFLALNWNKYSMVPMEEVLDNANAIMKESEPILPYKINTTIPGLFESPYIKQLQSIPSLHSYMKELIKVVKFNIILESSVNDLMQNYSAYKEDSLELFEDLQKYVRSKHFNNSGDVFNAA